MRNDRRIKYNAQHYKNVFSDKSDLVGIYFSSNRVYFGFCFTFILYNSKLVCLTVAKISQWHVKINVRSTSYERTTEYSEYGFGKNKKYSYVFRKS